MVLEGIKVVDFSWAIAGPLTTKYLADYGATVIKIESKRRLDVLRTSGPFKDGKPGINRSGYFAYLNANKYSMALDMTQPKAREIVKRLVSWADIVTEGFTPGMMEKWGLNYDELVKIKPDIIMLSTSNQGQTGPHSRFAGYGTQLTGFGGFAAITGWPDREPNLPYGGYTDIIAPRFGVVALIAALDHRNKTGEGQYIDVSQLEAGIHFLAPLFIDAAVNKREAKARGNSCPCAAPHGAYPCKGKDRWCVIAVSTDEQWQAFGNVLGNPPWTREPRFGTLLNRKRNEEELNKLVAQWTINYTAEWVMTLMQKAKVPAGIVQNPAELLQDTGLAERHCFWMLPHDELGEYVHLGERFRLSKVPVACHRAAPLFGEHTEYVCRQILGMSDQEFIELLNQGVFE